MSVTAFICIPRSEQTINDMDFKSFVGFHNIEEGTISTIYTAPTYIIQKSIENFFHVDKTDIVYRSCNDSSKINELENIMLQKH